MNRLSLLPATTVDYFGSGLAIFLSFLALRYSRILVKMQPNNFIWGFLFYFCVAMAAFSLSRGVGHIVRILLVFSGQINLWKQLSPLIGGFNTMLMISAAAVTNNSLPRWLLERLEMFSKSTPTVMDEQSF